MNENEVVQGPTVRVYWPSQESRIAKVECSCGYYEVFDANGLDDLKFGYAIGKAVALHQQSHSTAFMDKE